LGRKIGRNKSQDVTIYRASKLFAMVDNPDHCSQALRWHQQWLWPRHEFHHVRGSPFATGQTRLG